MHPCITRSLDKYKCWAKMAAELAWVKAMQLMCAACSLSLPGCLWQLPWQVPQHLQVSEEPSQPSLQVCAQHLQGSGTLGLSVMPARRLIQSSHKLPPCSRLSPSLPHTHCLTLTASRLICWDTISNETPLVCAGWWSLHSPLQLHVASPEL